MYCMMVKPCLGYVIVVGAVAPVIVRPSKAYRNMATTFYTQVPCAIRFAC
jgi:hypothetical protein